MSKEKIDFFEFCEFIKKEISDRKTNAGYSGSWGDNGASILESELNCWIAGREGYIPKTFEHLYKKYKKIKDEKEYQEYLRLKEKYDGN